MSILDRRLFTERYPREAGETRIYNLIILDESGSMSVIDAQALNGVNQTLQSIREAQQENPDDHQMISLVTFKSLFSGPEVRAVIDMERIENVQNLNPNQYRPQGGTPLFDAVGDSIEDLEDMVKEGDHVLVSIITDGEENTSRYYTEELIRRRIEELSAKGWVFTYIGANQDSEKNAAAIGIRCTMDFKFSIEGSEIMFDKMRSSNREYYKKVRREKTTGERIDYNNDFFSQRQALTRVTPEHIDRLEQNQIFVFGSVCKVWDYVKI